MICKLQLLEIDKPIPNLIFHHIFSLHQKKMTEFWYFCFICSKTIGLAPISWRKNFSLKTRFKTSKIGTIHNIVLLILYALTHLYFVLKQVLPSSEKRVFFTLNNIFIITSFSIIFSTVLIFTLNQQNTVKFCNELVEICQLLEIFNRDYMRNKFDFKLKKLVCYVVLCCLFLPIGNALTDTMEMSLVLILINDSMISWIIVQYVWVVALMRAVVETINDQFRNFDEYLKFSYVEVRYCKPLENDIDVVIDCHTHHF